MRPNIAREQRTTVSMTDTVYDVFLSYNSLDHDYVERIANELKARDCSFFIDRWYLKPGHNWVEALERELARSRSVAVFVGPREMGRWQQRERSWALDRQTEEQGFPVVPVLLPGCEPPLGFMKQLMWIDLRDDPTSPTELDALVAAVRREKVDRSGRHEPTATICPYRGLLAFREEDADFFFGREAYLNQLVDLVTRQNFIAVVGASGSGKSSLVSAGLIPKLRKQNGGPVWEIVRMVPDVDPLYSLAQALVPLIETDLSKLKLQRELHAVANDLAQEQPTTPLWGLVNATLREQPGTERLLLFVDQWEELYTNCEDATRRERFIAEVLEASSRPGSPLNVVLTVRGDFYGQILQHRALTDRIATGRVDLGPMDKGELCSVIAGPAGMVGLTFQDGLVDDIVREAGDEPGILPLLEFALEELWKRRDGSLLTHAGYRDLGRQTGQQVNPDATGGGSSLSRAIATYAEGVYRQLRPVEQQALPGLFRKLVRAGTKTEEDTRRRAALGDFDPTAQTVVRKLADKRLLITTSSIVGASATSNGGSPAENSESVEVAHEELLRRWGRLKQWVDEDREFLLWSSRIDLKVEEFQRDGAAALLGGRPLQESRKFYPSRKADLGENQRDFLAASLKAARRRKSLQKRGLAESLVKQLLIARTIDVPGRIDELKTYGRLAHSLMRKQYQVEAPGSSERLHLSLALMPVDADYVTPVQEFVGNAEPQQLQLICDRLDLLETIETDPFWHVLEAEKEPASRRFRTACALARFTRDEVDRWDPVAPFVTEQLLVALQQNPSHYQPLTEALVYIRQRLRGHLANVATDQAETEIKRKVALDVFLEYAADEPQLLAHVLFDTDVNQFAAVLEKLAQHGDPAVENCRNELEKAQRSFSDDLARMASADNEADAEKQNTLPEQEKERLAHRQANAAAALLHLKPDLAWPALRHSPDPRARSYLIHRVAALNVPAELLIKKLEDNKTDNSIRRAVLQCLGEYDDLRLAENKRKQLIPKLLELYRTHPDPGLHSAAEWLLRKWKQPLAEVNQELRETAEHIPKLNGDGQRRWYRTKEGHTMVVIDAGQFQMGSPGSDPDRQPNEVHHLKRIERVFALSATTTTLIQHERFEESSPDAASVDVEQYVKTEDSPMVGVTWYEAAAYCNWLSDQEDIPEDQWCYVRNSDGNFAAGMKPKPDFLSLSGYRLPTEAEWEYACRAGAVTRYYYGHSDALLTNYAWYIENGEKRTWPVGMCKPNDYGLFDMHGNVFTWCHNRYLAYSSSEEDVPDVVEVQDNESRVLRGGSFFYVASLARSAYRNGLDPGYRNAFNGFRVARTFTP